MENRVQDFEMTMQGLESGLRVEAIAVFMLDVCSLADSLESVRLRMEETGHDQIPVRGDDSIVGVVDRLKKLEGEIVRDCMTPLQEEMLVAATDPIGTLLPLLRQSRYRLVVRKGRITGIVTQSDLIKLPARLFAFAQITHLEMLMADRILEIMPEKSQWIGLLTDGRRQKVEEKVRISKALRLDPDELEFTDFCDKCAILKKHLAYAPRFESELKEIEKLRNVLFHAGDYGQNLRELQRFLDRLEMTRSWIAELGPSAIVQLESP